MKTRDAIMNTMLIVEKLIDTLAPSATVAEKPILLKIQTDLRATIQAYHQGPDYHEST